MEITYISLLNVNCFQSMVLTSSETYIFSQDSSFLKFNSI